MVGEDFPVILDWPGTQDNNVMHAKPDLRVFLKWMITRSGSVITAVIRLNHSHADTNTRRSKTLSRPLHFHLWCVGMLDIWRLRVRPACGRLNVLPK